MALLVFLKREGFGTYQTVDEFVGELARRSTSALGGFGQVLASKSPDDVQEAAQGDGQNVCAELVRDLRSPKSARLAALRALMLAGVGGHLPSVFAGAADLIGDNRMPDADRLYLAKTGLARFLESFEPLKVSLEVARGAATAAEAARVLGPDVVKEALDAFPSNHAGALTVRHAALGEALASELRTEWLGLLARQYKAAKNASPAAKRLGRAPEWPPVVPEVFRALLGEAEKGVPVVPVAEAPPAPPPPSLSPPPDAGAKVAPAINRSRTREAPPARSGEYRTPTTPVDETQLRWGPPLKGLAVQALRFTPHVTLVAERGVRALERLFAAFDARAAQVGADTAMAELGEAARARGSANVNQPMMDELLAFALDSRSTGAWRRAARVVLEALSPDRALAMPDLPEPSPIGRRVSR